MPRACPTHTCRRPRGGTTLLEVAAVLVLIGILAGIAVPRLHASVARTAARAAAVDVALLLSAARQMAATSIDGAAVRFDTAAATVRLTVGGDTVRTLPLDGHGVSLRASRDSIAYDARGLGYGAANVRVVLSRGTAAETLVVSRLGRLRTSY